MATIGIICQPATGHAGPMLAVGAELQRRGHRLIVLSTLDAADQVRKSGLAFAPIARAEFPQGKLAETQQRLAQLGFLGTVRFSMDWLVSLAQAVLRDCPPIIRAEGIDSLLIDMAECASPTLADSLGVPYVAIANTFSINEPGVPSILTPWQPKPRWPWRLRDRTVSAIGRKAFYYSKVGRWLNQQRVRLGLPLCRAYADYWTSALAQLSQYPLAFDFPRAHLPATWHEVGPLRGNEELQVPFPYERLDGRPLVYATLGTLQGSRRSVFAAIAEACAPLDVQLVITHGRQLRDEETLGFAGDPLVVPYAPQRALLAKAALTVTQAGMNTVLDSLSMGVPIVAIPLAFEQPGIAARLMWHGAGEMVARKRLSAPCLRSAIERVLTEPGYRASAQRLRAAIHATGGVPRASQIVEDAFGTRRPVLAA